MATVTNSRTRTIWSLNGRSPDSRDVYDYTGKGLRVGRIDIPASETVKVDGYSKVSYKVTFGDGSVTELNGFSEVISYMSGEIESKAGSAIMTVFLNESDSSQLGFYRIDVYKEWLEGEPDPEPEPDIDPIVGVNYLINPKGFGFTFMTSRGLPLPRAFIASDLDRVLPQTRVIEDLEKRIAALEASAPKA